MRENYTATAVRHFLPRNTEHQTTHLNKQIDIWPGVNENKISQPTKTTKAWFHISIDSLLPKKRSGGGVVVWSYLGIFFFTFLERCRRYLETWFTPELVSVENTLCSNHHPCPSHFCNKKNNYKYRKNLSKRSNKPDFTKQCTNGFLIYTADTW